MASRGQVLLAVDKRREDQAEMQAWDSYQKQLKDQRKQARYGSIFGSIGGAIASFLPILNIPHMLTTHLTGNPAIGMGMYMQAGSDYGEKKYQKDDMAQNLALLESDIFSGGKFNPGEMRRLTKLAKEDVKDLSDWYSLKRKAGWINMFQNTGGVMPWSPLGKIGMGGGQKTSKVMGDLWNIATNPIAAQRQFQPFKSLFGISDQQLGKGGISMTEEIPGPWAQGLTQTALTGPWANKTFWGKLGQGLSQGIGQLGKQGTQANYLARLFSQNLSDKYKSPTLYDYLYEEEEEEE